MQLSRSYGAFVACSRRSRDGHGKMHQDGDLTFWVSLYICVSSDADYRIITNRPPSSKQTRTERVRKEVCKLLSDERVLARLHLARY